MDALDLYLDSLAGLTPCEERAGFTVAGGEVWNRLQRVLSHGHGAPRHFLRWLHQRGAGNIRIKAERDGLTLTAPLSRAVCRQQLDYSGPDIDLARALVGSQQLEAVTWVFELDDGVRREVLSGGPEAWQHQESCGSTEAVLRLSGCSSLLPRWRQEIATAFGSSTTAIHWNDTLLSGPYVCPGPVLVWRHLRRRSPLGQPPLLAQAPAEALDTFRTARSEHTDSVLALLKGRSAGPPFQLLRFGEKLGLSATPLAELAGFGGLLRSEQFSTDLGGDKVVESPELTALLQSFQDEAVDMVLQLYQRPVPLTPEEADGGFFGLQSVLLHLLDSQRFTEGHLLAEWMGPSLERGKVIHQFRYGYTFDRLRSLLAEPAGHPQTAMRWYKQAETRLREQAQNDRATAEEALLINARLELRARRDNPRGLSGDLHGRLLQLANQLRARGHDERAASVFLLLGQSFRPGTPERLEHFCEAAECCPRPPYSTAVTEERRAKGEETSQTKRTS